MSIRNTKAFLRQQGFSDTMINKLMGFETPESARAHLGPVDRALEKFVDVVRDEARHGRISEENMREILDQSASLDTATENAVISAYNDGFNDETQSNVDHIDHQAIISDLESRCSKLSSMTRGAAKKVPLNEKVNVIDRFTKLLNGVDRSVFDAFRSTLTSIDEEYIAVLSTVRYENQRLRDLISLTSDTKS